ncbi:MAG: exodeoxyribonuclease VII small subunit [Acidimicrobiales bacterium]
MTEGFVEEDEFAERSFRELKEELESIAERLNDPEASLEEISQLVKRAKTIVGVCKGRIERTREEVDAILGEED